MLDGFYVKIFEDGGGKGAYRKGQQITYFIQVNKHKSPQNPTFGIHSARRGLLNNFFFLRSKTVSMGNETSVDFGDQGDGKTGKNKQQRARIISIEFTNNARSVGKGELDESIYLTRNHRRKKCERKIGNCGRRPRWNQRLLGRVNSVASPEAENASLGDSTFSQHKENLLINSFDEVIQRCLIDMKGLLNSKLFRIEFEINYNILRHLPAVVSKIWRRQIHVSITWFHLMASRESYWRHLTKWEITFLPW